MNELTHTLDISKRISEALRTLSQADSELKWELAASAADLAGVVDPTPVSDIVGAGIALRNGDLWGAGLSVASMVPYAGDALAKPAKALRSTERLAELQQRVVKLQAEIRDLQAIASKQKGTQAEELNRRINSMRSDSATPAHSSPTTQKRADPPTSKRNDCVQCRTTRLPPKEVPCFHPYDKNKFKQLAPEEKRQYLQKMAQQLQRQQEGLNTFSASEFKAARDAYTAAKGRNPKAAVHQQQTRDRYEQQLRRSLFNNYRHEHGSSKAAEMAKVRAEALMSKLAALHDPDMIAGGWLKPQTKVMGRKDVNSSIGGSWNQNGRVAEIDKAADEAIRQGRGNDLMNIKLAVCRGEGLR